LGLHDIAVEQARLAVEKNPDDMRLKNNLEYVMNGQKAA
jgi:hypothetical protein